jgi:stage V sporulation protein B
MALGQGAFAMLGIATTILTSLGRERTAALLTLGAVVVVGGACAEFVPSAPFGHEQLLRSAEATAGGLAAALVAGGVVVRAHAGAFVPSATVMRVGLALTACLAIGYVAPCFGRFVTPVAALVVAGAYVAILAATREIAASDLAMVRALRGPKAGRSPQSG